MSSRGCAAARRLLACFLAGAVSAANGAESLQLRAATEITPQRLQYEPLVAEVIVNGERRGEFRIHRDRANEYYFRSLDLAALGVQPLPAAQTVLIDNEQWVALRALGPSDIAFDESSVRLALTFPASRLSEHVYDLAPRRPEKALEPRERAAFLNYRLSASEDHSGEPLKMALANELAVRAGDVLLRSESALLRSGGATTAIRYETQLVYDRREDQQRLILGDHTAASGELGSVLPVGGIGFFKLYSMSPYLVRQPMAGFAGTAATPSQVEVRLGGTPVFREQVAPGPFEVRNLQNFAGARDVEVVVRDALGREQVVGFPYYFADQALRSGLHEYSYSVGALRQDLGESNGAYGPGVLAGFHRYGLDDRLTIGLRGEATPGIANLGPTALYRHDRLGALSASVALSTHDGRNGAALSLGHVYQAQRLGLHAMYRHYSDDYATAQDLLAPSTVRAELGVGGSYATSRWGTVFVDHVATERRAASGLPAATMDRLGYTYSFGSRASFFASLARTSEFARDTQFFVGLLLTLDRATTLNLSAQREEGREHLGAQIARAVPAGEGLGYRVAYDGATGGDSTQLATFVQYNARAASVMVDSSSVRTSGVSDQRVEGAVMGAVTYAGGRVALTRQIDDSFVAVQLAAPLEGVRVYSNNQEVGRTDRDGRLVVPRVGSFYETQISIEERDVPLEYNLGEVRRLVAPPYRSGSLLTFDVRRLRAFEGRLPAANAIVTLERDGMTVEFATGRDGRYYLEDIAPGRYRAHLQAEGRDCRFVLDVPSSSEPITVLPEVTSCD